HLKDPPTKKYSTATHLNRKERKERKANLFVRDTQRIFCDVFAFLAVLAVQVHVQSVDCATSSEGHWSIRWRALASQIATWVGAWQIQNSKSEMT
ncbi:MAG: hypothetical protein OEV48_18830, partial [Acidobacteriota bacterium]|nr:hypothetical protein [Acidobacteriota bacterium]